MLKKIKQSIVVLLSLLIIILPASVFAADAYAQEDTVLKFNENGKFRILIIADTQDVLNPRQETIDLMNAALDEAKPDLVVFTGDNIHGPDVTLKSSKKRTAKAIKQIMQPVVERDLPYCIVYGNHDDEGNVSKEYQMALYQSLGRCLSVAGDDMKGCGNYNITIKDHSGQKDIFNLWFVDSGSYNTDKSINSFYDFVGTDQIEWYKNKSEELKESNGGEPLPSFLFQHIAVPEIFDLLTEVPEGTENAVEKNGKYYVLNENIAEGYMGEAPCPPDYNNGEFVAWKEQGDIKAAFFGHDHVNDFKGTLDGIDMVYTPGAGFFIYGNGENHGVRVVEIDENDLSYSTELLYYKDLVGNTVYGGDYLWYKGESYHRDKILKRVGITAGVVVGGAVIAVAAVIIAKAKKKKHTI